MLQASYDRRVTSDAFLRAWIENGVAFRHLTFEPDLGAERAKSNQEARNAGTEIVDPPARTSARQGVER
jgi:hypothetical protein